MLFQFIILNLMFRKVEYFLYIYSCLFYENVESMNSNYNKKQESS